LLTLDVLYNFFLFAVLYFLYNKKIFAWCYSNSNKKAFGAIVVASTDKASIYYHYINLLLLARALPSDVLYIQCVGGQSTVGVQDIFAQKCVKKLTKCPELYIYLPDKCPKFA